MTGYTTGEVAEILTIPSSRVRSLARSGLLEPARASGRQYRFSFQDIVVLRVIRELQDAGIPSRRIHRALHRLRELLPAGRPLTAVHVHAVGDAVVVRDRDTVWEPESGQVLFDFAVADLASRAAPFAPRAVAEHEGADHDAEGWFGLGVDLEAVSVEQATEAYRRALELDPGHGRAHLNLGRLLHEGGDRDGALRHYHASEQADPGDAMARFNQGVALEDLGRDAEAMAAYLRALEADPDLVTAHFNLARLYEAAGDTAGAVRHLSAVRRLQGGAPR